MVAADMRRRHDDAPRLIGHRGAPSLASENTMASHRAALQAGLDGIEIDVHRTRDGVLAVHHDAITAGGAAIATTDWRDLHEAHPAIPRLEEILEEMEGWADRWLNVELKSLPGGSDGREGLLAKALAAWRHDAAARTWISSFAPRALEMLRESGVAQPLALLLGDEDALRLLERAPKLEVAGLHVEHRLATRDRIASWHAGGRFVYAWTVNDHDAAARLAADGIDGLIGDDPELLKSGAGRPAGFPE